MFTVLRRSSLLLQANVQLFGSYWCYTTSSVAPSITATLDGTQVGSVRRMYSRSCVGCLMVVTCAHQPFLCLCVMRA